MARRTIIALALLGLALAAAPALARTFSIDVPTTLADDIETTKRRTDVPVLLPSRLRAERRRTYPSGAATDDGWALGLDYTRDCGGANACGFASFTAERGARPGFRRRATLANGRTGYFKPLTCGASCSPPAIEWLEGDILYSISAQVGTKRTERRLLIRAANSAIKNGPR
jgi:hypothetical protein